VDIAAKYFRSLGVCPIPPQREEPVVEVPSADLDSAECIRELERRAWCNVPDRFAVLLQEIRIAATRFDEHVQPFWSEITAVRLDRKYG
jgi:hypothetical protein